VPALLAVAVSGRGLVDPSEPVLHADDEGFLRGRAAFETVRVYGGRPFRLEDHLARLVASAARLGLPAVDRADVQALALSALEHAGRPDAFLRLYVTPGREGRGDPLALVLVGELPRDLEELRQRGLRVIALDAQNASLIGGIKSTSYALNMVAVDEAKRRGADDAVFVSALGELLEGPTTNIWWRQDGTLFTPSLELGILAGVTRAVSIDAAPRLGYEVQEGAFPLDELAGADEAFTTSSVREVMPVVKLDGAPVGDGRPGRAARDLQGFLRDAACSG
jgi:branched-subunit amino acid aminotransferase/4-amino-4-deoxychorismate lyase